MHYSSLRACLNDLEKNGHLIRVHQEVDPHLEMAEIHRRVRSAKGDKSPAILFEKVKGSPFPAVSNLYGTEERSQFLFRGTFERVKKAFELKADPKNFFNNPLRYLFSMPRFALSALPQKVSTGPCLECETSIDKLPQIRCWEKDGGGFVLLPQVYTENQAKPGIMSSNLGMYRIQLSGNEYEPNKEIGLHYQIRRDIGIHHHTALERGEPLKVSIFVGGPPSHVFSAVMYCPEGMPEVLFAGALNSSGFRYAIRDGFVISVDADFCITGTVDPQALKPEGPFGDHLGYYSLQHDFPFMKVHKVYHRKDAIWPFTVVGRPPQEDSQFGKLIHELAGPVIKTVIPGVKEVHAVDEAGVHPLLTAIGSERYLPYQKRKPQELLQLSNAILGTGPLSLAKFLFIIAGEDNPKLSTHDYEAYFTHFLERFDPQKDLHFQTMTTMDTLDYSGVGINQGSKVILAAAGEPIRKLPKDLPQSDPNLGKMQLVMPGVLMMEQPAFKDYKSAQNEMAALAVAIDQNGQVRGFPLIVVCDSLEPGATSYEPRKKQDDTLDVGRGSEILRDFLWITFTRANPSHDIYGVNSFTEFKHWGCDGALIIDARIKPHHAPILSVNPAITSRVDILIQSEPSLKPFSS